MSEVNEISPLHLRSDWEGLAVLRLHGFVQTAFGPVDIDAPFVVKVSLPFRFEAGVPFYLYVSDKNRNIELLIAIEDVVDMLLVPMLGATWFFCWAELSEGGTINFNTESVCKGW